MVAKTGSLDSGRPTIITHGSLYSDSPINDNIKWIVGYYRSTIETIELSGWLGFDRPIIPKKGLLDCDRPKNRKKRDG